MNKSMRQLAVAVLLTCPISAFAGNWGLDVHAGTLGGGMQASYVINPYLSTRLLFNRYNYDYTGTKEQINYDFTLHLESYAAMLDWHPFAGIFRVSAGYFSNKNELDALGQPQNGNYIINGTTYSASQVGTLTGVISFRSYVPYLGIGWSTLGTSSTGLGFEFDLGALFQGSPSAKLSASGSLANNPQFQSDLAQEQDQLQNDVNFFKVYPVVTIGLSFRF